MIDLQSSVYGLGVSALMLDVGLYIFALYYVCKVQEGTKVSELWVAKLARETMILTQ